MIRFLTAGALMLVACDRDAHSADAASPAKTSGAAIATATQAAASSDAQPTAATLPGVADAALPGTELPAEQFHGRWTVERVAADASAPAGFAPDQGWIGRTLQFDEDVVGWTGTGTAAKCESHITSIVRTAAIVRHLAQPFRPAWSALNIPLTQVGLAHRWECDTAEPRSFGPDDGIFFPVGKDRLVLNWNDHTILLLRRTS